MSESPQNLRKTYKFKLKPTPAQARMLDSIVWACRRLYNTALEQRITLWKQRGVSVSQYAQEAELKDLRAAMPEYAAIHSHVLQDVLARLNKTYQDFFRRVTTGQTPGFPRFQGRNRWHSFTYKGYGNGACLDNGFLVLSKIGRMAVRWSRPMALLPGLRDEPPSRPQRRQEYRKGRAGPSGRGGVGRPGELRIRRASVPAECQGGSLSVSAETGAHHGPGPDACADSRTEPREDRDYLPRSAYVVSRVR